MPDKEDNEELEDQGTPPENQDQTDKEQDSAEEAGTKPGGPELSPDKVVEIISSHPAYQELVQTQVTEAVRESERVRSEREAREAQAKEYAKLVEEGRYDEIGRRVVETNQRSRVEQEVSSKALQREYQKIYSDLFSQPELQQLSSEERQRLDPKKFETDSAYVLELSKFISEKRVSKDIDARVEEKLKAKQNEEAGKKVTQRSPSSAPAPSGEIVGKQSSADLLGAAFRTIVGVSE